MNFNELLIFILVEIQWNVTNLIFFLYFVIWKIFKNQSKQHMSQEIQMAKPEQVLHTSFHQDMFPILKSPHSAII